MRLIDADAFKDYIRGACEDMKHIYKDNGAWAKEITESFCKDIDEQPTIQPEQHWIPCSAELPKTNDPVNVTYVNHNPGNYYAEVKDKPYTATAHFHNGQWYWYSCTTQDLLDEYGTWIPDLIDKDVEITAWRELPEPYKGVTE